MSRHIQLSIPESCHENWDNMTPAEKGRFCASCQKQVIDFTMMNDSQVAAFFKKPKEEPVCGRFFRDQLDRDIEIPKKRIPWVKYFFQFALPAFIMSAKATAQGNPIIKYPVETTSCDKKSLVMGDIDQSYLQPGKSMEVTIKGKVTDEKNNPLPYASIIIKGTSIGVAADSGGVFHFNKISFKHNGDIVLEISSVGFETEQVIINKETDLNQDLAIQLKTAAALGEVVVASAAVGYRMGSLTGAVCMVQPAKQEMPVTPTFESMIKVYPNPVVSGTSINIGCQKIKEGYYIIKLLDQSGQQILNKQTWIDADAQVLNIDIPSVAAGVYFVKLTNKDTNKKFTQKIIVQ